MQGVYVTRDSEEVAVEIWPATIGIRKFRGCIIWVAGSTRDLGRSKYLNKRECRKRFGFYPRAGTAWWVSGKGRRSKVDIDFSD